MPELLANPPWYIPTALAALAVIVLYQGNRTQNQRLKTVGLVCAGVAVLIFAVGHLLESDREAVARRTRELATTMNERRFDDFAKLLDEKVQFKPIFTSREQMKRGAEATLDKVGVKDIALSNFVVTEEAGAYVIDFTATAEIGLVGRRAPTDWRLTWVTDDAGEFVLFEVRFIPNPKYGEDVVMSRIIRP